MSDKARLGTGSEVRLTLHVKATVLDVSDSHGLCYLLELESREFVGSRRLWVDSDEILRGQSARAYELTAFEHMVIDRLRIQLSCEVEPFVGFDRHALVILDRLLQDGGK